MNLQFNSFCFITCSSSSKFFFTQVPQNPNTRAPHLPDPDPDAPAVCTPVSPSWSVIRATSGPSDPGLSPGPWTAWPLWPWPPFQTQTTSSDICSEKLDQINLHPLLLQSFFLVQSNNPRLEKSLSGKQTSFLFIGLWTIITRTNVQNKMKWKNVCNIQILFQEGFSFSSLQL